MPERKMIMVIEPTNPYLVSIKDLAYLEQFIQIFSYKTILDIIGEAVELHFNGELNEHTLSDTVEELLLSFRTNQINLSFSYMPFLRLMVSDQYGNRILTFNLGQLINLLYWQVQRLISDYLIAPLNLKPNERVYIEGTTVSVSHLQFIIKIVDQFPTGNFHANPIANVRLF